MSATGILYPNTAASVHTAQSTDVWVNINNMKTVNGVYATNPVAPGGFTENAAATNFSHGLAQNPATVITGVQIYLKGIKTDYVGDQGISGLGLVYNGNPVGPSIGGDLVPINVSTDLSYGGPGVVPVNGINTMLGSSTFGAYLQVFGGSMP